MNDPVESFIAEARNYCALIETDDEPNSWVFAQKCLAAVLRLHYHALALPAGAPDSADALDQIDHEAWQAIMNRIQQKLARDQYWVIFEPLEEAQPEADIGSISDDLADIWRNIKDGLLWIDRGQPQSINDAVWHWRITFETHWANHASGAACALTALCYGAFADCNRPQHS